MRKTARLPPIWTALTLIALIAIGCSSGDERLVELSRQSTDRQAEQNRLVETNNRQVLEATNRLVEADAKSRTENIELHRQIEAERSGVNQQRDALEQERRQIAVGAQSGPDHRRINSGGRRIDRRHFASARLPVSAAGTVSQVRPEKRSLRS